MVELHAPDGTVSYLVGPLPQWGKRGRGAELVNRYGAQLTPDPELIQPDGRLSRLMITPATSQLRRLRQWPPVLVAMLRARGVAPLDDEADPAGPQAASPDAPSAGEDRLGQ